MQLIEQKKLYFKQGNSDKVYEVDLCEVDVGLYVVNFRYGRRNSTLKEGTKTEFPVDFEKAKSVYSDLIQSKLQKGYNEQIEQSGNTHIHENKIAQHEKPENKITQYLQQATENNYFGSWKLSRIIWRAGELQINEAGKYVEQLISHDDFFVKYSACFALGRIKYSQSINALTNLKDNSSDARLKRFANVALLNMLTVEDAHELLSELFDKLPNSMKDCILNKKADALYQILHEQIFNLKSASNEYLWDLYLLSKSYPHILQPFRQIIAKVPFKKGIFQFIRYIFKAAELWNDYQTYGLIAYRIVVNSLRTNNQSSHAVQQNNGTSEEQIDYTTQYSMDTAKYLKKSFLRKIIRYGIDSSPYYTKITSGFLVNLNDEYDKNPPFYRTQYHYDAESRRYITANQHFDSYCKFIPVFYILYSNSQRYEYAKGSKTWICKENYKPGDIIVSLREEAFPKLWDAAPEEIIFLLCHGKAEIVHVFASKVFKANSAFIEYLRYPQLLMILDSNFEATSNLGINIAKQIYEKKGPVVELALVLLKSKLNRAVDLAFSWILKDEHFFLASEDVLIELIFNVRQQYSEWLSNHLNMLLDSYKTKIFQKVFSKLNTLGDNIFSSKALEIIKIHFVNQIQNSPKESLYSLLDSEKEYEIFLAGQLLSVCDVSGVKEEKLVMFLESGNEFLRKTGFLLLSKLPVEILKQKISFLVNCCISQKPDVRKSVRPVIAKFIKSDTSFGQNLVNFLLPFLTQKETYDNLHEDISFILLNELSGVIENFNDKSHILHLLYSKYEHAQILGTILFRKHIPLNELSMNELVGLSKCDIKEIRKSVCDFYTQNIEFIKKNKGEALKLLDTNWDETRLFGFEYFRNNFNKNDWDSSLLVSICDHVKDDVQNFGRELIMKFFSEENSIEYLVKLSQHPGQNVQLFTSNFVERFASGRPDIIITLFPYFQTALSQINKGRVLKLRIMQFLRKEALINKDVAQLTMELLQRLSLSIVKKDKSDFIELMHDLHVKYPDLNCGLKQKNPIEI